MDTEKPLEVRIEIALAEMRESEFWNRIIPGSSPNGTTIGDTIGDIIEQLVISEVFDPELDTPEAIFNDLERRHQEDLKKKK